LIRSAICCAVIGLLIGEMVSTDGLLSEAKAVRVQTGPAPVDKARTISLLAGSLLAGDVLPAEGAAINRLKRARQGGIDGRQYLRNVVFDDRPIVG
jgi:hypothetical protein